jgi:hypothetical protein
VHAWFVTEWNAGLYPYRRHIYKPPWYHSSAIDTFPLPSTSDMTTAEQALHIDTSHMPIVDANLVSLNHGAPEQRRSVTENAQIQAYLYSLSTPGANHKIRFGTDAEDICIDTGASACISRLRQNFITLRPVKNLAVNGIGSGLPIAGIGTLRWSIFDDKNNAIDLYIRDALFVPTAPMGLLCPQQIAQQTRRNGDGFNALSSYGILTFEGYTKTVPYDQKSRLPIMCTIDGTTAFNATVTSDTAGVLSKNQLLLLRWHQRLSHLNFAHIQALSRQGRLPKALANCEPPVCKSCQFGKAHRRPVASVEKAKPIDANDLNPGDCVSVDQIESSEPGYVDVHTGKPTTAKYHAASLYTDHASRFMYLKCHYSTGGQEAVAGKCLFEQLAAGHGIKIKAYRGDNGIMAKRDYLQDVEIKQQSITFAGVNNHSQNGIAERGIRTICDRARTMLLHAMMHWPEVVGLDLWPFALKFAVDVHNATPGPSGLSPEEIFSKQKSRPDRLLDFHTFGCPVYVLDPRLQQGSKIPKWQPRSRQACYLGHSPRHAQTVPVVLNIKTGLCSPQYHVVFDDYFTTTTKQITDTPPPQWADMFRHNRLNLFEGEPDIPPHIQLAPEWLISTTPSATPSGDILASEGDVVAPEGVFVRPSEAITVHPSHTLEGAAITQLFEENLSTTPPPEVDHVATTNATASFPNTEVDTVAQTDATTSSTNTEVDQVAHSDASASSPNTEVDQVAHSDASASSTNNNHHEVHSRPGWNAQHGHNTRFRTRLQANFSSVSASTDTNTTDQVGSQPIVDKVSAMISCIENLQCQEDGTVNYTYPCAFATNIGSDTLNYGEMLASEDRQKFAEAMQVEINGVRDMLEVVQRQDIPAGIKPLPAIWAFKRKRLPDWTILKWKARINVHGGRQQQGINYWETYAPVVNWTTVRLTFILSLLKGFHTKQVDFVQAFTQAPLDCPIYMEIPAGFHVVNGALQFAGEHVKNNDKTYVLKLLKNMYGLKQAGNNWYNHLTENLINIGFRQSRVDKCLFIRSDCVILIYVDDCLIFSPSNTTLTDITNHLKSVFKITSEDDVGAYLGIDISRNEQGHLILRQPGLIDKAIALCGLESESNQHNTPADKILHSFIPDDSPRQYSWSYRQLIGVLNYIASTTRPDISFAVHQCARFSNKPTRTHELAVKRIVRYLKGTRDKGFLLKPNGSDTIDCFVDADFAGTWNMTTSADPSSVKSRTGYVITFAGCPVLWSSKLQSEIALSTTEAEYIALSTSLRDLIPMRTILNELSATFHISPSVAQTHSTIFEDNKSCVDLIAAPTMRPRSRHIAIKYHHFREHVRAGQIHIKWISTEHQLADIFTKPLPFSRFSELRLQLLGW